MGDETKISWCNRTWSPWGGCQAVSLACDFCYAEELDTRYGHSKRWGPHGTREERAAAYYRQPFRWNAAAVRDGVRDSVFPSMCDPFDNHKSIKPEWRDRLWETIRLTPAIDWLLLTKRTQNISQYLPPDWGDGWRNVWLGTTVENQQEADRRIPHLEKVPAILRFLSCEPLLGKLILSDYLPSINWVICGGESGSRARPMHISWARSLRDQCAAAGTPFHFKQWGAWLPGTQYEEHHLAADPGDVSRFDCMDLIDERWLENPDPFDMTGDELFRVGVKLSGNLLDGRQHLEFPKL